ncbi:MULTISPECIES: alpha/beta hydrolase [unclassified Streptomyces]|uniref:alpha/beta fold hydrolase n=1 Tax=unclassified Streptomyces TaxID=2593676 RepID=UPI000DB93014|nr:MULTISPECIES: alpha/beta hydrolase [unclassified Streptomyces]MYT68100.1 alpha/beta hydrolase [Streptomyces sp. SID8367]RAJ72663.1 hypothetical protein K377_07217 [Streptomyces sp. PsTaAH-137]
MTSRRISRDHPTILLIHGGLWQGDMNADRFWGVTGIVAGIERAGFTVLAPNRLPGPSSWIAEVEHLAPCLPGHSVALVAGSNGCSVAVGLALAFPNRIERMLLAWPATGGDPLVDARTRAGLAARGASEQSIRALLDGQTIRGVADSELSALTMPVGLLPAVPENSSHQRRTIDTLRRLLPHSEELEGCPEPPLPGFAAHLDRFLTSVVTFASR